MFLTKQNIQMNKVISHIHYIYIESPFLKKKDWIHTFYNTSLFQFKTLAMQLSLHLIWCIIRLYSCNINPHLVNLWFLFCILLINMTVLWSVNTKNGWNVHHNCFKENNKARTNGKFANTQLFSHWRIMGQAHYCFPVFFLYHYMEDHFAFILHSRIWRSPFCHQYLVFHEIANITIICFLYWEWLRTR
jgi:hypothetical protein